MNDEIRCRIKALRNKKGITQSKLGEILGISQNAISLIESGKNKPSVQQIETLSGVFDVSADYLLFGIENIEPIERDFLRMIRDDKSVFNALLNMLETKNHFEELMT
ncbi:MAG: helix-turn-helix transcriptional regulator [Methylococcales bacterium]|nr:helix-turn-helix transcriptional regulator [Methylococcales bacterium]